MFRVLALLVFGALAALHVPRVMDKVIAKTPTETTAPEKASNTAPSEDVKDWIGGRSVGGTMVLRAAPDGHYYTRARINGRSVDAVVDTGASLVALSYADARKAGLNMSALDFNITMQTANGKGYAALVNLDELRIGSVRLTDVRAVVAQRGKLGISLLGMSFLGRLSRADMRSGELILKN